jgi:hypothetical protein
MEFLEAKVVNANHLKLLHPIHLPSNSKVMITVVPVAESSDEHEEWLQLSQLCLKKAYSEGEPDYSEQLIKKANPDFER